MVAGDRDVVAHSVHDVDDGFALGHGADGLTLDGVAVVHQQDVVVLAEGFLHGIHAGVGPVLVHAAVHVARKEDDEVLLQRGSGRFLREYGGAGQQQGQRQQDSKQFLHNKRPPDLYRFVWVFFPYRHYSRTEMVLKGGTGNVRILSYVTGYFSAVPACRNILWKKQARMGVKYKVLFDKGAGKCYSTLDGVSN